MEALSFIVHLCMFVIVSKLLNNQTSQQTCEDCLWQMEDGQTNTDSKNSNNPLHCHHACASSSPPATFISPLPWTVNRPLFSYSWLVVVVVNGVQKRMGGFEVALFILIAWLINQDGWHFCVIDGRPEVLAIWGAASQRDCFANQQWCMIHWHCGFIK